MIGEGETFAPHPAGLNLLRLPVPLPCDVRVIPGTSSIDGTDEERSEWCAVHARWLIGRTVLCDPHLRGALGDQYEAMTRGTTVTWAEALPWEAQERFEQPV